MKRKCYPQTAKGGWQQGTEEERMQSETYIYLTIIQILLLNIDLTIIYTSYCYIYLAVIFTFYFKGK